jgi:GntR family transcriptional regulator
MRGGRSDLARYVRDLLRSAVLTGAYPSGRLPTEDELTKTFAVSRNVIRAALELLREENLIERARGAGTFVVVEKSTHDLATAHDLAEEAGTRRFRNVLIAAEYVCAPPIVAEALACGPSDEVMLIDRVVEVDGEPMTLSTHFLRSQIARALRGADLSKDFYELLEQTAGVQVGKARLIIEAVAADDRVAALLRVPPGSPLLLFQRLIHDVWGNPIALGFNRVRGDRLSLVSWLQRMEVPGVE